MSEILKCLSLNLGISLLVAWLLNLLRRKVRHGIEESTQSLIGNAVSFVATLFAFLLGFVIVALWGIYNDAEKIVRVEANELRTIYRLSAHLQSGEKLQGLVRDYASSVATDEWPAMMQGTSSPKSDELKNSIWREALHLIDNDKNNPILAKETLDSLVRMNTARRERLDMLALSIHPLLLVGLAITGLSTVAGLFFLGIKHKRAQFIVDFLVLLCITLNMYLVVAVDQPFSGTGFTVSPKSFSTLADQMTTEITASANEKLAPSSSLQSGLNNMGLRSQGPQRTR
jgi:hypothetical protein